MPQRVQEKIDYNNDGREDFQLVLDTRTGKAGINPYSPTVRTTPESYKLKDGWAVRVPLHWVTR